MRIVRSIDDYAADADLLLSIGVFDGVHIGHRAVLASLVRQRDAGSRAAALTFDHHPQAFLHPSSAPKALTTADEKINLLYETGLDVLFMLPFDERIASLSAESFLRDVLLRRLRTKLLVVGENWRFGKGRAGDSALAKVILEADGCRFEAAVLTASDGDSVSSSRIRSLIEARDFVTADRLLGAPYVLRGLVVAGEGRGHVLGFPTANLEISVEKLVPPDGVYGALAHHDGRDYTAVISIGSKPTFNGTARVVEAHLLDFHTSIYGDQLSLRDWSFVREQERYDGAEALIRQIDRDVAAVRDRHS
jgi:riboflavin kinase/FMN adenylyltransferase